MRGGLGNKVCQVVYGVGYSYKQTDGPLRRALRSTAEPAKRLLSSLLNTHATVDIKRGHCSVVFFPECNNTVYLLKVTC